MPALYNIIKTDDVEKLDEYFRENPNYHIFTSLSYTGNNIYYQAIETGKIRTFIYLTHRIPIADLKRYSHMVVASYKKSREIFDYYYHYIKRICQEENDYDGINRIVVSIVGFHQTIYKELLLRIIGEYDFLAQFQNDIFRKNLENSIVESKSLWILYFEKYYRENNLCRNQLLTKGLLFSKFGGEKYRKRFKHIDYTQKVRIEGKIDSWDYLHQSKHEYSLEFILWITCSTYQDFSDWRSFEDELMNLMSEAERDGSERYNPFINFLEGENNIFYLLMEKINQYKPFAEYKHIIDPKYHPKLLKITPHLSNRFIDLMRKHLSYEGFDMEKYHSYSYTLKPECVMNSRLLLEEIMNQWSKVNL